MSTAVAEAMVTVTIDVTQDDLDRGEACKPRDCPLWHAFARAFPHLREKLRVGAANVAIVPEFDAVEAFIELPRVATGAVNAIDCGELVRPFSFDVQVPAHLARPS